MGLKGRICRVLIAFVVSASVVLATTPTANASIRNDNENALFNKINNKRVSRGTHALKKHQVTLDQTRTHSKDMAARLTMDHNGYLTRFANIQTNDSGMNGYKCENVASVWWSPPTAYSDTIVPKIFFDQWKNSTSGHKECMFDIGHTTHSAAVGLAKRVVNNRTYWFGTFITGYDSSP